MNKAILIGRLAADPELRTTGSGVSVCKFTLAVTRRFADANGKRQADFLPVIVWRQQAEVCARYLSKGKRAAVSGEIQTRSYDAQDGTKRYVTEIIAESVEFLTPRSTANGAVPEGYTEIDDDELPF